ncbi:nuclear transport factor 2 family protein [Saccharopolyspora phatthalungensis]|uniref:3-phenylpropionate/cinnamic acid dioxygenase small subunit n=1 Tax=Saccharopolyspora phatthalungensis TaxID=664693 RepID=A0A840QDW0_9PSEU|nr:nuclear transport factor 2 family protein [Saccharopolyspora phatthalungensis]MBB5158010.1 3-phenylpropionate/cinnamic acid dioxygenase small subunit [Saccharopolyspora phatthalungensis]
MTASAHTGGAVTADHDLRSELTEFYARQMQALDAGQAEQWAATFTEDGVFAANAYPQPTVGRAAITEAVKAAAAQLAADQVVHRHWLGMLAVYPVDEHTVRTRFYALVIQTPKNGVAAIHRSTIAEDELVRGGDGWQVRRRDVTRDDL